MNHKWRRRLAALGVFLTLLLTAAAALASETPWGTARVIGFKDDIPNTEKKFAPYAVYKDQAHAEKDEKLYLKYKYVKVKRNQRCWGLELVNEAGDPATYKGELTIYLPYPSIWSESEGCYWKWTKRYAERCEWSYSRGYANIDFGSSKYVSLSAATFRGEAYREAANLNDYGVGVYMGRGFRKKDIMVRFEGDGKEK